MNILNLLTYIDKRIFLSNDRLKLFYLEIDRSQLSMFSLMYNNMLLRKVSKPDIRWIICTFA